MQQLNKSAEDYLEKILMLQERQGYARSVDIANELKVTKPSVSVAMKRLREEEFIEMDKESHPILTDKGREVAARIYDRHKVLSAFFRELGVSEETAAADACLVEHVLSEETYAAICRFVHKSL